MKARDEIALEVAEERRQASAEVRDSAECPYCGGIPDDLCERGRCDDPRVP